MEISGWTLAFQAINFLVLAWLLQRFLYKPVLAALDRRRADIDRVNRETVEAKQSAEALREELARQRDALSAERAHIIEMALADAEKERQKVLGEASADTAHLLEQARAKTEQEQLEARRSLQREATKVAVELASRMLSSVPSAAVSLALLDQVVSEVEMMSPAERARLCGSRSEVTIVVPQSLPEADVDATRRRIETATGRPPVMDLRVDPNLIAGVELRFPYAILRRSWREGLEAARAGLAAA